ncbi:MAG: hypothetical protein DCF15_12015 [Phormidesmis priestleyi]|uniref:Uncharacterized protein n=1 Tax=Phormidesmis priestleyi TaxID=268141 RepID=A0A2W4XD22_9CYAN|nr:MAG: hypothetical protein DCF15_12015 [Phormidesmis priestleyi]
MLNICNEAITRGVLINRQSKKDKEFHFQNWFQSRLEDQCIDFDEPGRNTYPDFRLVQHPLGYELKGLAFPGRVNDYDCNSQMPHGIYRGRHIFYVFGRYPANSETDQYSVHDLVICHGSLLNANDSYLHKNKSTRGMGSYGDILLRDRKMYVAPTPFGLLSGVERQITLILPASWIEPDATVAVGDIKRTESDRMMAGYTFDLTTNTLIANYVDNPTAGREHCFVAYRPINTAPGPQVTLR